MKKYEKMLKALSDVKRLKTFALLLKKKGKYYVCEIADSLEETHYNTSKYLKDLKLVDLVEEKKVGRGVLYSAKDPEDEFTINLYKAILSIQDKEINRALKLLELRVSLREENKCVMRLHPKWQELIKEITNK